jgi:hypothetical protein
MILGGIGGMKCPLQDYDEDEAQDWENNGRSATDGVWLARAKGIEVRVHRSTRSNLRLFLASCFLVGPRLQHATTTTSRERQKQGIGDFIFGLSF